MIRNDLFILNLARTCTSEELIREDGRNLNLFNRLVDLFRGKHGVQHFQIACKRLSNIALSENTPPLPVEAWLEILGRFRQIQKKIRNENIKQDCGNLLHQVEEAIFKKEGANDLYKVIFQDIEDASRSRSKQKIARDIRKLEAIVDYHEKDHMAIGQIVTTWYGVTTKADRKFETANATKFYAEASQKVTRLLLDKEENRLRSGSNLEIDFDKYPQLLRLYLNSEFNKPRQGETYRRIHVLKRLMNQYANNERFIFSCLENIEQFLSLTVFKSATGLFLSGTDKGKLLALRELFPIINQHIPAINNQTLVLALKVKLANLPCPAARSFFPNVTLSEKEQLNILIEGFQRKENETVELLVQFLTNNNNPTKSDRSRIAKLVHSNSTLSDANRLKLRDALSKRLQAQTPKDWDEKANVLTCLDNVFQFNSQSTYIISVLRISSKAKKFFSNQLGLEEGMILIPRWYHATSVTGIHGILQTGEIEVHHRGMFQGAWISSHREEGYGDYVLSLSDRVTSLSPRVNFTPHEREDRRWRGIQRSIPLKPTQASNLTLVGVPVKYDRTAYKVNKLRLVEILKEKGFPNPMVLSVYQVDFIQESILGMLGTPNLSDHWWGVGQAYSEHQLQLQSHLQSMPFNADLFVTKSDSQDQVAIAKIVQSMAVPLYKVPMPQSPSYRSKATSLQESLDYHHSRSTVNVDVKPPARKHHGTMHCVRTALWTQVLSKAYVKLGREKITHPIALATAGALHDVGREGEGRDQWDEESADGAEILLGRSNELEETINRHVHAIREKDPPDGQFVTDEQRIVHDADCVDIIRVVGRQDFKKSLLCFYGFDDSQRPFCNQLINEFADFIQVTEAFKIRSHLEHHSTDFYGDLVRILFKMKQGDNSRFPLITELLQESMGEILKTQETDASTAVMSLITS